MLYGGSNYKWLKGEKEEEIVERKTTQKNLNQSYVMSKPGLDKLDKVSSCYNIYGKESEVFEPEIQKKPYKTHLCAQMSQHRLSRQVCSDFRQFEGLVLSVHFTPVSR